MPKPVSKTWFEIQDKKIGAKLDKIIGQLEELQASIDGIDTFLGGYGPKRLNPGKGSGTPIDEGTS